MLEEIRARSQDPNSTSFLNTSRASRVSAAAKAKLPQVSLPVFYGNITHWTSF